MTFFNFRALFPTQGTVTLTRFLSGFANSPYPSKREQSGIQTMNLEQNNWPNTSELYSSLGNPATDGLLGDYYDFDQISTRFPALRFPTGKLR